MADSNRIPDPDLDPVQNCLDPQHYLSAFWYLEICRTNNIEEAQYEDNLNVFCQVKVSKNPYGGGVERRDNRLFLIKAYRN